MGSSQGHEQRHIYGVGLYVLLGRQTGQVERPKFVRGDREVENHGVGGDEVRCAL